MENELETNYNPQETTEIFANGLLEMLLPVVQETDNNIQKVFSSQELLNKEIQRLSSELEAFVGISQTPALNEYVHKLTQAKQRAENIQVVLLQIQERVSRMERIAINKLKQ
eukprot:TRINITY_DN463_c1_g1_i1.p1 TRINITY_DN463_c1_g1~~TRINITY_DN463_c1_g1_i1.p1  ORF type:complete len:112 (-),score=31.27 TRINITY_DN463_c1_g1_i1:138-473(-)